MKPLERQHLLLKFADLIELHGRELALLNTLDMGAPIGRSGGTSRWLADLVRFYASAAVQIHGATLNHSIPDGQYFAYTVREPVGVVGAIIPWNSPRAITVWKLGPALATGCTIVLKPAEEAPLVPLRLGELIQEAGFPDGVVNIVPGFGETAGAALAAHPGVDKVSFTGSHLTGQKIVGASTVNLKRVSLELGGKSPNIVFADADMDLAVPGTAMATFINSGQACDAGTRLFVEAGIYEEFVSRVAEFGRRLRVGNGLDPETQIGPLVSQQQLDRVTSYLTLGSEQGARLLSGGERILEGELANGYFMPPTVFADVRDDMSIARDEIFGPVISALAFNDLDEVIQRANDTQFGLGSGIWTRDLNRAHQFAQAVQAGAVWVNCYQTDDPTIPFGGYKMSGYGKDQGNDSLADYLNIKAVVMRIG
jgi:aldehyde dehydrogenase (NAD+)